MNAYKLLAWQLCVLTALCLAHVTAPATANEVDFAALDRLVAPAPAAAASPVACLDALCDCEPTDFSALDRLAARLNAKPAPGQPAAVAPTVKPPAATPARTPPQAVTIPKAPATRQPRLVRYCDGRQCFYYWAY